MAKRVFGLLTIAFLAGALAAPSAALAAPGATYLVGPPNGHNDTAAIQQALDWCAAHGPGCTVQLRAGTYKSDLLVEYHFRGTFKGTGQHRTTIAALPGISVTEPDPWLVGECPPNLTDCRYPIFIMFVDGNVAVSDLTLDFPNTNGTETAIWTAGGTQYRGLFAALMFTGDGPANGIVDRVGVTGRADTSPTNLLGVGFNVAFGIVFDGYFPVAPFPSMTYATRSGVFAVRDSSIRTVWEGVIVQGTVTSSQVTIAGNRIDDAAIGIDVGAANSTFDISDNSIAADNASAIELNHIGVLVEPSNFADLVSRLSRFSIHDNTIAVSDACGCEMLGLWLFDAVDGSNPHWFRATIMHNTISLPSTYLLPNNFKEGIDANNITSTVISGNTFTGTSTGTADVISLWGNDPSWLPSTGNVIAGNSVSGLKADPSVGLAQYYLDPYTSQNLLVCTRPSDTALDQGTRNTVLGCDPSASSANVAARAAPSLTRIPGLKGTTFVP
jgi:hypothetical protein